MKSKQIGQISMTDEIIVDLFAGGGGASTGIEIATGRVVNVAVNHNPEAIRLHQTNHKFTEHYQEDVWKVDPKVARCGNAVCPPMAEAVVRANLPEWCGGKITTMEELRRHVAV